jgi:hypothetical protein
MISLTQIRTWGLSREEAHYWDQKGFPGRAMTIRQNGDRELRVGGPPLLSGISNSTTNDWNGTSNTSKMLISTPSASYPPNASLPSSKSLLLNAKSSSNTKPVNRKSSKIHLDTAHPSKTHLVTARPHLPRRSPRSLNKRNRIKPRRSRLHHKKKPVVLRYKRIKYNLRGVVRLRFDFTISLIFVMFV